MYKLIVLDLDGTLLNSKGELSKENEEAIKKAKNKGIKIAICSGRILPAIRNICLERGIGDYLISGNGSQIYEVEKNEIIYENCMDKDMALKLIKFCEENSIYYSISAENSIIASSLSYNVLAYNNENYRKINENKTKINLTQNIYEYVNSYDGNKFIKFTICDNNKNILNKIIEKLKKIKGIDVIEFPHMAIKNIQNGNENIGITYYYVEIINAKANKWEATKILANKLGINDSEIVSFGDNINDKELIQNSGLGFAMENASEYVKNIADKITTKNDENGVAKGIEEILRNM